MRPRMIICVLLGLTACTGGSTPRAASPPPTASPSAAASPSPTSSPSPSPSAAAPLMVAVAHKGGGLALYSVAPGAHVATLVRRLVGPAKGDVEHVSLSAGPAPSVCANWSVELRCFRPGAAQGRVVTRIAGFGLGIRADGRALAWTEATDGGQYLVIADLAGDVAAVRRRMPYNEQAPEGGYPEALGDLDWIGPRTLVGTAVGDSDESVGLCVIDVDHPRPQQRQVGFGRCLTPRGAEATKGYAHFDQAALVAPGEAVVVERAQDCCNDNPGVPANRAVRLRLSDGAVLSVFASPRPGRHVLDVSGGARAVLYTTGVKGQPPKDVTVSLRWADEAHGAPLTGLPADLLLATAQP